MANKKRLSLRKRREIARKTEAKEFQIALTSAATDFITAFVLPQLMANAQCICPGVSRLPTITIDKADTGYFVQVGKYKTAMPADRVNGDILQEALSLAPAFELIPYGNAEKASFSMPIY